MSIDRKPDWLRIQLPGGEQFRAIKTLLRQGGLHTVCEEARCPNLGECWRGGTATFMLLGKVCTRGCRFCAVTSGNPRGAVDLSEPYVVADAVRKMALRYVVLTSVDRDDLPDGGAEQFARTVRCIKRLDPAPIVETLIPDFQGDEEALRTMVDSGVDVLAHNIETVRRLSPTVRDRRAGYDLSLRVLEKARALGAPFTKSSIMLGLGETRDEVLETMRDLRARGVDIVTLGQYLRPSRKHLPVREYLTEEAFAALRRCGEDLGFAYVAAGPLVRSSYRAAEFFVEHHLMESPPSERVGFPGGRAEERLVPASITRDPT